MSQVEKPSPPVPLPQVRDPPPVSAETENDLLDKADNKTQETDYASPVEEGEIAPESATVAAESSSSSPETPPNVVSPPELSSDRKVTVHNFVSFNRGRVVSLDGGRELMKTEMDEAYPSSDTTTDNEGIDRRRTQTNGGSHTPADSSPDDDDGHSSGSNTSDGESSYFAKHLPSPKSGRKFSYSSAGSTSSAPARAGYFPASSNAHRESDASLSFSDDDDDWNESDNAIPGSRRSPMLPPTGKEHQAGADDLQMYPQRITRMHSVSSLVSSSSEDGKHDRESDQPNRRLANSPELSASADSSDESVDTTSTSDPSVRSELRDVASSKRRKYSRGGTNRSSDVPSGRRSPVPGGEFSNPGTDLYGRFFASPPRHPLPSPPTIFQGYAPANTQGIAHPQPHPLPNEQIAAWMAAGNAAPQFMPPPPMYYPPVRYGATMMAGPPSHYFSGERVSSAISQTETSRETVDSHATLPFVYSDDDDTDDSAKNGNVLADGRRRPAPRARGANMHVDRTSNQDDVAEERDRVGITHVEDTGNGQARPRQRRSRDGSTTKAMAENEEGRISSSAPRNEKGFRVYWQRWLMLMYMSVLNLLSDWTCYSVAPISILTSQAFGQVNPELLVVVFLGANAVATACEPIILSRLGLRRTVLFGALLLMMGSVVKSGGLPPILQSTLVKGRDEWRIYMGFFLVGLSQPLYQCTPALLSASWFPERERTMATGVALNANQLGIGCAFIFGTLLVADSEDIPKYFGLLSVISTITFAGCLIQFEDAPPTPPSETARIIKGTLELRFSSVRDMIWKSMRSLGEGSIRFGRESSRSEGGASSNAEQENPSVDDGTDRMTSPVADANDPVSPTDLGSRSQQPKKQRGGASGSSSSKRRGSGDATRTSSGRRTSSRSSSNRKASTGRPGPSSLPSHTQGTRPSGGASSGGNSRRRSGPSARSQPASSDHGFRAGIPGMTSGPSPALLGAAEQATAPEAPTVERESPVSGVYDPSPMMPGRVGEPPLNPADTDNASPLYDSSYIPHRQENRAGDESLPYGGYFPTPPYASRPGVSPYWQYPYWDTYSQEQGHYYPPSDPYLYPQMYSHLYPYQSPRSALLNTGSIDDGAEPVLTLTPHHLDIDIRDDQILLSFRACISRPGFVHALVSFTVSGIVINTLSTFMDYLVRLNGAGREYVGIVGGSFQFVIMISSLIVGKQTDKTRAYYSVTIGMLVLGAFGLAECGVSLDADRGGDLRWALVVVAALVGPLQPVSTEMGVDVAYPLSENTVLVIQQLFSNLLSALFIPFFKAVRDVGTEKIDAEGMYERPQYTFSFYLLIVLHATATVFFATFNGRYLRYEHEQAKKALEEQSRTGFGTAFSPVQDRDNYVKDSYEKVDETSPGGEHQPLVHHVV